MADWFQTVTDLDAAADILRRRRHGVIEVRDGRLFGVHLRPWPKLVSLVGVAWGCFAHRRVPGDRMRLYYDQPRNWSNFLALKFALSARDTTLKTSLLALRVLDQIAAIKQSDALLMDATNFRLSPRMLARFGWQPHAPSRWHRNYIKRMYEMRESSSVSDQNSAAENHSFNPGQLPGRPEIPSKTEPQPAAQC